MIGDGNPLYYIKPRRRYGFGTQRTKEREERRSCFFRFLFSGYAKAGPSGRPEDKPAGNGSIGNGSAGSGKPGRG